MLHDPAGQNWAWTENKRGSRLTNSLVLTKSVLSSIREERWEDSMGQREKRTEWKGGNRARGSENSKRRGDGPEHRERRGEKEQGEDEEKKGERGGRRRGKRWGGAGENFISIAASFILFDEQLPNSLFLPQHNFLCTLSFVWRMTPHTYWIENHSEKELPSMNTLVQFLGTSWIFLVENCVREEPTGLPWKNLKERWPRKEKALVTFIEP